MFGTLDTFVNMNKKLTRDKLQIKECSKEWFIMLPPWVTHMNYFERIQLNKKIASRDFVIIAKFFSLLQNGLAYKEESVNSLHIA